MREYEFMRDTDENGSSTISVSSKRKRKLDLIPRILCLIVALIVWLWIVNFNDRDVTETLILKVEYSGLETIEKNGMMIYGMDKREIIITVKGSNRDIRKHDSDEYRAVVDVSSIGETGQYTLPLSVEIPSDINVTITSDPLNVSLIADESMEKEIGFDARSLGLYTEQGITFSHTVEQSVNSVTVKGPKQIVDMINSARFNFDGSFVATEDEKKFTNFPLVFLDSNLNEVVDAYNAVKYSTEDITVDVHSAAHKRINLNVKMPAQAENIVPKISMDSIELWGIPSVVRAINDYTISIDMEKIEIGKPVSYTLTNGDFPEGADIGADIIVTISFEEFEEKIS